MNSPVGVTPGVILKRISDPQPSVALTMEFSGQTASEKSGKSIPKKSPAPIVEARKSGRTTTANSDMLLDKQRVVDSAGKVRPSTKKAVMEPIPVESEELSVDSANEAEVEEAKDSIESQAIEMEIEEMEVGADLEEGQIIEHMIEGSSAESTEPSPLTGTLAIVKASLAHATEAEKKAFFADLCSNFGEFLKFVTPVTKPAMFASIMSEDKEKKSAWIKVGSKRTQAEAKEAARPVKTVQKWSELAASKVKKMCPNDQKLDMAPIKSVHVSGFRLLPGSPIRMFKNCLAEEFGFDVENIWHLSYRGRGIMQLVMVTSSIPSLVDALKGNKFGFELRVNYDPRRPDEFGSSAEALSNFKYRIDKDMGMIRRELPKVYNYKTSQRMKEVLRYLDAYRDCSGLEPILPPAEIPYFKKAFESFDDDDNISVGNAQC